MQTERRRTSDAYLAWFCARHLVHRAVKRCYSKFNRESAISDQQFKTFLVHLRILIVTTGISAGALLAIAWEYL
jgi:hypothetical protein